MHLSVSPTVKIIPLSNLSLLLRLVPVVQFKKRNTKHGRVLILVKLQAKLLIELLIELPEQHYLL